MFGFFKKKPDKYEVFSSTVALIIKTQLTLGIGEQKEGLKNICNDPYTLGYIFGCQDAALQALGIDETTGLAMIAPCNGVIFSDVKFGQDVSIKCLQLQSDNEFQKGQMLGGKELFGFLKEQKPPMGLAQFLLEGRKVNATD